MTDPFWANRFNYAEFLIMPLRTSLVLLMREIDTTIQHKKSDKLSSLSVDQITCRLLNYP